MFPCNPNTEKLPLMLNPKKKARTLKPVIRIKALKSSGDLIDVFSPLFPKVLLLLNRGNKDWINPVTQKKLMKLAINKKTS